MKLFTFKHKDGQWFYKANTNAIKDVPKRVEKDQPPYIAVYGIETFAKQQMKHMLEKAEKEIKNHLLS